MFLRFELLFQPGQFLKNSLFLEPFSASSSRGVAKGARASSFNNLMVEIGKMLGEIGDKSGKNCKKTGNTDFDHPLEKYP